MTIILVFFQLDWSSIHCSYFTNAARGVADKDVAWFDDGDASFEFLAPVKRNIHDEYQCLKQQSQVNIS